ncbi:MAG: hypothetical protein WCJ60_01725 [bacterium]
MSKKYHDRERTFVICCIVLGVIWFCYFMYILGYNSGLHAIELKQKSQSITDLQQNNFNPQQTQDGLGLQGTK